MTKLTQHATNTLQQRKGVIEMFIEQITIDARHPNADTIYEKCVNAWYAAGFANVLSFDQVCTMQKVTGETVEISYGTILGYGA
jgi:hypothetical protein